MRILGEVDGGLGQAWLNNHLDYFCVFNLGAQRIPESKSSSAICLPDLFSLLQSVVILVETLPHIDPRVIPTDGFQYPHATAVKDSVLDMIHHFAHERYEGMISKFRAQAKLTKCRLSIDHDTARLCCSFLAIISYLFYVVDNVMNLAYSTFWVFPWCRW